MWCLSTRRLPVAAAGLAACLAAAVATAAPARAEIATISGRLLAADTGQPPTSGACVNAFAASDGAPVATSCVDETGAYTLDGLTAGSGYFIVVNAGLPYVTNMWLPGSPTFADAQPVVAPATVDVTLPVGGTLTGTMRFADGEPAAYVAVRVFLAERPDECCMYVRADGGGKWTFDGLYPWSYKVQFDYCCPVTWAFGKTDWESADVFAVSSGETITVDDLVGFVPSTISGSVMDAWTGAPVEGICSELAPTTNWDGLWYPGGCTDQSGNYQIDGLGAGQYYVRFTDFQGRYALEYYNDASDLTSATVVTVASRSQVTGIDAALTPAAVLTGRVVDASTKKPVPGACPRAFAGRSGPLIDGQVWQCSQDDGRWQLSGLPAGATTVYFPSSGGYLERWAYSSATQAKATVFSVAAGTTTTLRDVKLTYGGTLAGVVTDAGTGAPVAGAWVTTDPFDPRGNPSYLEHVAQTDDTGHYTINGLTSADYTPLVFDQQGVYGFEWSGNADSRASATPISLRAGRTTIYNVALDPAAILSGEVIGASGVPSASPALVDVFTATGDPVGWTSDVLPDGTFTVTGLPGGDVAVRLTHTEIDLTSTVVWHDGASTRTAASLSIVTHVPWD